MRTKTLTAVLLTATIAPLVQAETIKSETLAANRAEELKRHLGMFELFIFPASLNVDRKPGSAAGVLPSVTLTTVDTKERLRLAPGHLRVTISEELAGRIIGHLLESGALAAAEKHDGRVRSPIMRHPGYYVRVQPLEEPYVFLETNIGFNVQTIKRLTVLRNAVAQHEPFDASVWLKGPKGDWLCPVCKGKMFIQSVGKCSGCEGFTSSGAHKLCAACSAKEKRCKACGCAQVGPATAAMDKLLAQFDGFRQVWDGSAAVPPQPAAEPPVDPKRIPSPAPSP